VADTERRSVARFQGFGQAALRVGRWSLLAVPVGVFAERAWSERWVADDGFIHLRMVSQITAGHGPVFNAGERVEASTSPLWTAVLVAADVLTPIRLEWIAVLVGIGLSLAGLAFSIVGSRRLSLAPGSVEVFFPAGALVLVAMAPVWSFASAGLEGGIAFAWIGACLWILASWARRGEPLPWWAAALVGLGPLIRPDLAIMTVLFLAAVLMGRLHDDSWGDRARLLVCALGIPVAYQLFRMGYYGSVVPNPAVAKEASLSRWDAGWDYLRETVDPYVLWFPLLTLAAGGYLPKVLELRRDARTRALLVVAAFAVGGVLHAAYVVRVGGDFMHARLLLPSLQAIAAPVAVLPLRRAYLASLLVVPWAVVAVLFLRSEVDRYSKGGIGTETPVTVDDYGWGADGRARAWFTGDGAYFDRRRLPYEPAAGRRAIVAHYGVGIASYALGHDVYVLDLLGLADPFTSHLEIDRRVLPGHEKPLPAPWVAARITADGTDAREEDFPFLVIGSAPLGDAGTQPFDERVERARSTMKCSDLQEFFGTYSEPLTVGRFLDNLVHAFGNTLQRIPPEPRDAARYFCGRTSGR
jgi:arabinofuranosyltransferase